jgi:hypothetical protein
MPLLLIVYHALITNSRTTTFVASIVVELSVFGSLGSTEEITMGLIKVELSFLKRTTMPIDPFSPFSWWAQHEQQFPNLIYLAWLVMGIVGSQIEIERNFIMVGVITGLRHFQLGIENLNNLILTMKTLPYDPRFGCTNGPKSFEEFFNSKDNVVFENEYLILILFV